MDDLVVQCPFCFEVQTLEVEPDVEGSFVQDCEVCCRPWQVHITRDEDGVPSVTVGRA